METAASRRFSFWRSARARLALSGLVLAGLVSASAVVFLRDDDEEGAARRDAVEAYISEINKTEQELIGELDQVNRAYGGLRLSVRRDPQTLARLEGAERTLRTLHARLVRLPAPADARRLRAELLRLVRLQIDLAAEVAGMAQYIPVQAAHNRAVAAATEAMRTRLGAAESTPEQRGALAGYEQALRRAVAGLEAAEAPRVLEPARTRELARLRELGDLSHRLTAALAAQRAADVDRLLRRFLVVNASTGTTRAERDAVVAYNRRVAEISKQQKAVSLERVRLDLALR
jgi:hypothetical protein